VAAVAPTPPRTWTTPTLLPSMSFLITRGNVRLKTLHVILGEGVMRRAPREGRMVAQAASVAQLDASCPVCRWTS
jgi:hypothetical protein